MRLGGSNFGPGGGGIVIEIRGGGEYLGGLAGAGLVAVCDHAAVDSEMNEANAIAIAVLCRMRPLLNFRLFAEKCG